MTKQQLHSLSYWYVCMHAQSLLSSSTFHDSTGCSPPGSSVPGDSPGKNAGVGDIPFSRESS